MTNFSISLRTLRLGVSKFRVAFFLLFSLIPCYFSFGQDFGLILDQKAGFSGNGDESVFDYSGILVPRFSTYWGDGNSLYVSAGVRADYLNKEWAIVPELLRTEVFMRFGNGALKAGRMQYADPLGYIAAGLFDGARFGYDTSVGSFGIGAWYTGFLYKKRTEIAMNAKELLSSERKVDYADFADSYFAPRRFLAALDWRHQSLAELFMVNAALLGQFDLTGEALHSQYLTGTISMPYRAFIFKVGGGLELIQDSGDSGLAFAAELDAIWALPFSVQSRLEFLARYGSGHNGSVKAFLTLTTESQGFVLKADHSGITLLSLDYAVRLHETCSLSLSSSYFIRNDKETLAGFGSDGNLLGNEFLASVIWSPLSDMRFNLGAGLFLPSMGNVAPDAKALWRIEANAIISIY